MRTNYILTAIAVLPLLVSCGASRKAAADYEYQQWKQQQAQQQQRPTRQLRTLEPCIALAQEQSENLRAYGTATSYVEKVALNEAERDARNRLAQMLKVAVEGAAQDYGQNANQNLKNTAGNIGESIMTQYVAEEVANTRIIKTSIYDLSDGSIQVYVCLEMQKGEKEFTEKLANELDRDGVLGLQYDRDRFMEKMAAGLEEYKKKNMAE